MYGEFHAKSGGLKKFFFDFLNILNFSVPTEKFFLSNSKIFFIISLRNIEFSKNLFFYQFFAHNFFNNSPIKTF